MKSRLLAGLAVLMLTVSACSSLPDSGPVVESQSGRNGSDPAPFSFDPPMPKIDGTPDEIVAGFLTAMQATGSEAAAAGEFLTGAARDAWRPDEATIVFTSQSLSRSGRIVRLDLQDPRRLSRAGRYQPQEQAFGFAFRLVRVNGQWRIDNPPDALIVPRSFFTSRYGRFSLFFFDPAGEVLVAEPVYLPRGVQAPTKLLEGLLAGPERSAAGLTRSYLPEDTKLAVAAPISELGRASVPLEGALLKLPAPELRRAAAQIVMTLTQLPSVVGVDLSADGQPVELQGQAAPATFSDFNSALLVDQALYGVRAEGLVRNLDGAERLLAELPEEVTAGLTDAAAGVGGDVFALTTAGGVSLVDSGAAQSARVTGNFNASRFTARSSPASIGRSGEVWAFGESGGLVTGQSAAASSAAAGPTAFSSEGVSLPRKLPAKLEGGFSRVVVNADGTRVVLVPKTADDEVWTARVVRDGQQVATRLVSLTRVRLPQRADQVVRLTVRDVTWRDATTVAVLSAQSNASSAVITASADGADEVLFTEGSVEVLNEVGTTLSARGDRTVMGTERRIVWVKENATAPWEVDQDLAGIGYPRFAG